MTRRATDRETPLRIGGVTYLNSVPLLTGLEELLPEARLSFDLPSRLADDLDAGRLDAALVPSIELARHPEWSIVSDACIAARGPVRSVKVLFRRPPREVRTLSLDEGSRTSAALAQILLADEYGVRPRLDSLAIDAPPEAAQGDAVLVIGDRAIRASEAEYVETWDLGDRWNHWTGLPFVFAAWAARPGIDLASLEPALESARDAGRRNVARIAAEQAASMELPYEFVLTYLRDHLHFKVGVSERRGLDLFYRRAAALGLIPEFAGFQFHDRAVKH